MDPINGFGYFGYGQNVQRKSELDFNTFLQLLTVQLATQNPLEPMNDRDFFAQLAQLGQVQGIGDLQKTMDMGQAAGLIGKKVKATRQAGDTGQGMIEGSVQGVTLKDGTAVLSVKEANGGIVQVPLDSVTEVFA